MFNTCLTWFKHSNVLWKLEVQCISLPISANMWHIESYEFPFGSFTCHGVPDRKLKAGYNASNEFEAFGKSRTSKLFSFMSLSPWVCVLNVVCTMFLKVFCHIHIFMPDWWNVLGVLVVQKRAVHLWRDLLSWNSDLNQKARALLVIKSIASALQA